MGSTIKGLVKRKNISRPLRIQYANAWYHVMNRGRRGETIFKEKKDSLTFIDLLKDIVDMWNVRIAAYCRSYGVKEEELLASRRGRPNEARNVAIHLLRQLRGSS